MKATSTIKQALTEQGYLHTDINPGTTDESYTIFEGNGVVFTVCVRTKEKADVMLQDVIDAFASPNYHI